MRAVRVLVSLAACVIAGVAPASAQAKFAHCGDVRVDRFLQSDRNGDFGAFDVTRTGTTCKAARRVAARYVHDPRAVLRPKRIERWRCTNRPVDAQVVWVTCTRRSPSVAQINFLNWVPSG